MLVAMLTCMLPSYCLRFIEYRLLIFKSTCSVIEACLDCMCGQTSCDLFRLETKIFVR